VEATKVVFEQRRAARNKRLGANHANVGEVAGALHYRWLDDFEGLGTSAVPPSFGVDIEGIVGGNRPESPGTAVGRYRYRRARVSGVDQGCPSKGSPDIG
jgi:hypothetical protein